MYIVAESPHREVKSTEAHGVVCGLAKLRDFLAPDPRSPPVTPTHAGLGVPS